MLHCTDNRADRALGMTWERHFCELAATHGLVFSPLQIGRADSACAFWKEGQKWHSLTLPDVTIWTAPGQHHEIKHKAPTRDGCFGLEVYRFMALLSFARTTGQAVHYTIHNHALAGGRDSNVNNLDDWMTAEVRSLNGHWSRQQANGTSWIGGARHEGVSIYYWPSALWQPLGMLWGALKAI